MARGDTLAPGFRFHPTDEELIRYYLKRKVTNKPFRFDPISVVDIYKTEPWDLPGMAKLKTRDLEWYFFSALDKKYSNGSKTNRATEKGYWKTTGKDRPVHGGTRTVGMKKTLVFHIGRAPRGERTNWVMHEYRLCDEELEKAGIVQDAYVLCRIFQKSGTGPKNGEQYGAPFVEEEWDDEEEDVDVAYLPCVDVAVPADEMAVAEDAYVETIDFDQNQEYASENLDLHSNFYYGDTSNHEARLINSIEDEQKPMVGESETQYVSELAVGENNLDVPGQYDINSNPVANHYIGESSHNLDVDGVNFLLDEPYLDATDNPAFDEGLYLEANDLSNSVEAESAGDSGGFQSFEEYLNFFDAMDENLTFDPSDLLGSEDSSNDKAHLSQKVMSEGTGEVLTESSIQPEQIGDSDASTSEQKPDTMKYEPDMAVKYPFLKQASHMLGGIHAPPSLASEFPIKDAALRLNAAQASSSVRVTAGLIRIDNMTLGGNGMDWSFGKNGTVNIILSFGLPQGDFSGSTLMPTTNFLSGKTGSIVWRSSLLLMFFWILILSVSCKIGTHICGKLSGH